ncbi:helix-turn-helix domain-containing protein [Halomonas organivorans]|uniref:Transcriptional regulator with XRE-family HTH domain n=1 Tax=Halomonas organivorans TaxID=257772 RepID=A0A7W5BXX4_9GAMM|nr:helix-turn-helix domain-containing protein [Halomonas organivorans]MBB3141190.1 transcriptional regulator with XRE-family HTH domain [Halomonas organivorans]
MDTLGPRIKHLRLEAKLNKAALARRVGVSDVTISYWESGAIKQIGHERLVALAAALNCPLSALLDDEGTRPSPLFLRADASPPWTTPDAKGIELPIELTPGQRWDGDCHLVTPAPGESFDYLGAGDLAAIAPTEIFRQPGLYLIEEAGRLALRRVQQDAKGALTFQRQDDDALVPYTPDCRLLGKIVSLWRHEVL